MSVKASKLAISCVLALGLVASIGAVTEIRAAEPDIDAAYRDPNVSDAGHQIVILKDESQAGAFSYLINGGYANSCSSMNDEKCSGGSQVGYRALLQPCAGSTQLDCISTFGSASADNVLTPATFVGTFPTRGRHAYTGDESLKLPSGGAATIWSLPSLPHAGGDQYMVRVQTSGYLQGGSFSISDFGAEIIPIEIVSDPCVPNNGWGENCDEDEGLGFYEVPITEIEYDKDGNELPRETRIGLAGRVSSTGNDCMVLAQNQCAKRHAFPGESRFALKVRLSQSPKGWLHGRISKPSVAINQLAGTSVELDIVASTVKTPIVAVSRSWSSLPQPLQDAYRATGGFNGASAGTRNRPTFEMGPEVRNAISAPTSYSTTGMSELIAWLPYIGDKSTADISKWTLRSLSDGELAGASSCFSSKAQLNGLVMTNATQYSAGPPTFDRAAGSLDYKVAAPHYTSGGSVFLGTYDLVMRSDVARCIYGFSKAPLNASISVVDNEGVTTTATKLVSERDGWLRIAAYGFGFSSPTIKVVLTQESTTATKTTGKKVTITCKKGKLVKKVTALKPTCPKGYKKA